VRRREFFSTRGRHRCALPGVLSARESHSVQFADASIFPPGTTGCGQLAIVTDTATGSSVTFEIACAKCGSDSAIRLAANTFPNITVSSADISFGEWERYSVDLKHKAHMHGLCSQHHFCSPSELRPRVHIRGLSSCVHRNNA
jgi:hypothetical protein